MLRTLLIILDLILCLAVTIITFMQSKEDEGASATITGGSSSFYEKNKGRTKEGKLKRLTIFLAIAWVVCTVVLSVIY